MPTISATPTMCPPLKELDISSNEGRNKVFCTFHKEVIKMPKKKGGSHQVHLETRDIDQRRFHRESDI